MAELNDRSAPQAMHPAEVDELFAAAMTAGDLDAALSLYEPGAAFVVDGDEVARGTEQIRAALADLIALNPTLDCYKIDVLEAGDLAVLRADWIFTGSDADGEPFESRGRSIEVVRRQPDGSWLFAIDLPSGASPVPLAELPR